jgi:hypothetical protein
MLLMRLMLTYSNTLQQYPAAMPYSKMNSPQSQDMQVRRAFVEWSIVQRVAWSIVQHVACTKLLRGLGIAFSRAWNRLSICNQPNAVSLADNPPSLLEEPVQLENLEGEDVHVL